MRFIFTVIIWIVLVGGLYGYIQTRDRLRIETVSERPQISHSSGDFTVSVTPTFSVEDDPFALQEQEDDGGGFELWLNGKQIEVDENQLHQGTELRVEHVSGITAGGNEIYLKASPPLSGGIDNYGVRVQVFEDEVVIADKTIWSNGGALVSGTITVAIGAGEKDEHDH